MFLALCVALSIGATTAPVSAPASDLDRLEQAYAAAKAGGDKTEIVSATVALGTAVMTAPELAPKDKYPRALKLYGEALALDPNNAEALTNKKLIEDIYRSMDRPIPQ